MSAAPIDEVLARLSHVKKSRGGFLARCPAHEDREPSLSIHEGVDGRVLLKCWAGCETGAVLAALNLKWRDLFPPRQHQHRGWHR